MRQYAAAISLFRGTAVLLLSTLVWGMSPYDDCSRIITIIAVADASSPFHIPNSEFGQAFAQIIRDTQAREGGFKPTVWKLIEARRKVAEADLARLLLQQSKLELELGQLVHSNGSSAERSKQLQMAIANIKKDILIAEVGLKYLTRTFEHSSIAGKLRRQVGVVTFVTKDHPKYAALHGLMQKSFAAAYGGAVTLDYGGALAFFQKAQKRARIHKVEFVERQGKLVRLQPGEPVAPGENRLEVVVFRVTDLTSGYEIRHTEGERSIELVERYVEQLWDEIVFSPDKQLTKQKIAEFEWFFMGANLTGRGAASIGDAQSLILQKQKKIPWREEFRHVDFHVLSSQSLQEYIDERTQR